MEEIIFIDLEGNIIQYKEICSHIGLAVKLITENEKLKELYNKSGYIRADLFLINEIGYMSVSVDPVFGINIVVNNDIITDIQRKILMNYGIAGAKISFLDQDIGQDTMGGRHIR